MNILLKIPPALRSQLWALIVLIDFDYKRLCIVDHQVHIDKIVLWLEDEHDIVNSLASCLKLEIPIENLAVIISPDEILKKELENLSYRQTKVADRKIIDNAINWFSVYADRFQKKLVQEILLTKLMNQLMDERKTPATFQMAY